MPYNETFKYSDRTAKWATYLPPWTKIAKDPESVGQQFFNAIALEMDETSNSINQLQMSKYINQADISQKTWIKKVLLNFALDQNSNYEVQALSKSGDKQMLNVEKDIKVFYDSESPSCIFDFDENIIYVDLASLQDIDAIEINGAIFEDVLDHHIWNSFDEIALLFNIERRHLESNESLKKKIASTFIYKANASREGIMYGLAKEFGFIKEEKWLAGSYFTLNKGSDSVHIDSLRINGRRVHSSECLIDEDSIKLHKFVRIFPLGTAMPNSSMENCIVEDGNIQLVNNALSGQIVLSNIYITQLDYWNKLFINAELPANTSIKLDIIDSFSGAKYKSNLNVDTRNFSYAFQSDFPNYLKKTLTLSITLSRKKTADATPSISLIDLSYENKECSVNYILKKDADFVKVNSISDTDFVNNELLKNAESTAEFKKDIVDLIKLIPIFWNSFKWDEAYWDSGNRMNIGSIPNLADTPISSIPLEYRATGVSLEDDIKPIVRLEDNRFNLYLTEGYCHLGDSLELNYLFSSDGSKPYIEELHDCSISNTFTLNSTPKSGSPVICYNDKEEPMVQVAFLDDNYNYTIENKEQFSAIGESAIELTYKDIMIQSLVLPAGFSAISLDNNLLTLNKPMDTDPFVVRYKVNNSYIVNLDSITVSNSYPIVKVVYVDETYPDTYKVNKIVDPMSTHLTSGFLYIDSDRKTMSNDKTDVKVSPDFVSQKLEERAMIHVDCFDDNGNPAVAENISAEIVSPSNCGTLVKTSTNENRTTFVFTVDKSVLDGTIIKIAIKNNSNEVIKTVEVKARCSK